jgi:mannonate dehydratase
MTKHQPSAGCFGKVSAAAGRLFKGKRLWLLVVVLAGLLEVSVVQESVLSKAPLWSVLATSPVASQFLDQSKGKAGSEKQPNMRSAWGIAAATDEVLKLSAQLGVRDIVIYGGPGWEFNRGSWRMKVGTDQSLKPSRAGYEDYLALRKRVESYGLRIAAIEGGFVHLPKYQDLVFGGPKRQQLVEELIAEISDMARAGIPIYGYHWMPGLVWRTPRAAIRGGAVSTAFDFDLVRAVDSIQACETVQAKKGWQIFCDYVAITKGQNYPEEKLWQNLEYWIKAVTPAAEKVGIRLGIHPDDPPVPMLAGLPRLLRNHAAYRRLVEIYPSDSNGIEFCQGTFSEMEDDVYEAIRYFGQRNKIQYVHFRNVSGRVPKFHEEFINTGYVDMYKAMKLYREVGFKGVFIDDHCPDIEGDRTFQERDGAGGYQSRAFAQGYIQAMLEAVQKQADEAR